MKKNKLLLTSLFCISLLASCNDPKQDMITWYNGVEAPVAQNYYELGDYYFDQDDGIVYKYTADGWKQDLILGGSYNNTAKTAYELYKNIYKDYDKSIKEWNLDLINGQLKNATTYVVTYNLDNGSDNFTHVITENKKAINPEVPKKEGYKFIGWYNQNNEKWLFDIYTITEDVTLTAKWEKVDEGNSEQPSTPSNPSDPSTPSSPSDPSTPSTPSDPSTPSNPSDPSTPSTPSEPSTPSNPSGHIYTSFTSNEVELFNSYIGFTIPFVSNDEYYVEEFEDVEATGLCFYTFGNTQAEFNSYLSSITSSGFTSDGTEVDEYGDTWYLYSKGDVYLDVSYYSYEGSDVIDLYVYKTNSGNTDGGDTGGDDSGSTGGDNDSPVTGTSYNKVTSSLSDWSGNYLIVYEGENIAFNAASSEVNKTGNYTEVAISNNSIAYSKAMEDISVTISKVSGGYTIQASNGKYIGATNSENMISADSNALVNTIEYTTTDGIVIKSEYNTTLRFNTSWKGFRFYKSGQAAISLYKLNGTTGGNTNTPSNPITPTGDVTALDFTSSSITYKYKKDINYYEYGCPTMDNGTTRPKVLVIPVEFSDVTASSKGYTIDAIKNAFLPKSQTNATLDYVSVYDYFYASSYGKLSLDITVCDSWFRPSKASTDYADYYEEEDGYEYFMGDQLIMDEALSYLSQSMDLSSFDSDGDAVIDSVVLINTLDINPDTDFYWAYQYYNYYVDSEGYYYEYDGVSANTYLWAQYKFMFEDADGEYTLSNPTNTYTFIHEFSHVLGADDYYDYSQQGNHPLDGFDIMDMSSADHNPFTKMHYGWLNSSRLITTSSSVTVDLKAFEETGDTIIIANNYDETKGIYQEYWLICYYNNTGLNQSPYGLFDETGIVVYHVNAELQEDSDGYLYFKNSNTDASDEYGTVNNLIEFVSNNYEYVFGVNDTLSASIKDDNNVKVPYTFKVDSITSEKATLTFTVNN